MDERAPAAGKSDEGDADWIGVDMTESSEQLRALAIALGKHQPNGWNRGRDKARRPYKCRCGLTYNAGPDEGLPMHQARALQSLLTGMVVCNDCGGIGDDLCDDCDGTGRRGRGNCSACGGTGYLICPTCDGVGVITLEDAESRGWA